MAIAHIPVSIQFPLPLLYTMLFPILWSLSSITIVEAIVGGEKGMHGIETYWEK